MYLLTANIDRKSIIEFLGQSLRVKVFQSCSTLWDPMDYTVNENLQSRILEWVVFPFSRGSTQPRNWTQVSYIADGFFTIWTTREDLNFNLRDLNQWFNYFSSHSLLIFTRVQTSYYFNRIIYSVCYVYIFMVCIILT